MVGFGEGLTDDGQDGKIEARRDPLIPETRNKTEYAGRRSADGPPVCLKRTGRKGEAHV